MSLYEQKREEMNVFKITLLVVVALIALGGIIAVAMAGLPMYNVYRQKMDGQALLAHAVSSKEIAVCEAKAKMESAELLAKAEVIRAEGVAKANTIIGKSLEGNEAYLRYLYINGIMESKIAKEIIYLPTEAGIPILEAGRHLKSAKEAK